MIDRRYHLMFVTKNRQKLRHYDQILGSLAPRSTTVSRHNYFSVEKRCGLVVGRAQLIFSPIIKSVAENPLI